MQDTSQIPPGFRFDPTDSQALKFYLIPKLQGQLIFTGIILDGLDVYLTQPSDLPGTRTDGEFVYYFTTRKRKNPKGGRADRCTKDDKGTWKLTSKVTKVYDTDDRNLLLGYKNTLVYTHKDQKNKNGSWIMHEYVAAAATEPSSSSSSKMINDALVLSRIYHKKNPKSKEVEDDHEEQQLLDNKKRNEMMVLPSDDQDHHNCLTMTTMTNQNKKQCILPAPPVPQLVHSNVDEDMLANNPETRINGSDQTLSATLQDVVLASSSSSIAAGQVVMDGQDEAAMATPYCFEDSMCMNDLQDMIPYGVNQQLPLPLPAGYNWSTMQDLLSPPTLTYESEEIFPTLQFSSCLNNSGFYSS